MTKKMSKPQPKYLDMMVNSYLNQLKSRLPADKRDCEYGRQKGIIAKYVEQGNEEKLHNFFMKKPRFLRLMLAARGIDKGNYNILGGKYFEYMVRKYYARS